MTLNVTLSDWFGLHVLDTEPSLQAWLTQNGLMAELRDCFAPVARDGASTDDIDVTLGRLMIVWEYKIIGDANALDRSVAYIEDVIYGAEKFSTAMGRPPQYSSKWLLARMSHLKDFALYIRGRSLLTAKGLAAVYRSLPMPEQLRVDRLMQRCLMEVREATEPPARLYAARVAHYFEGFYALIGEDGIASNVMMEWIKQPGRS